MRSIGPLQGLRVSFSGLQPPDKVQCEKETPDPESEPNRAPSFVRTPEVGGPPLLEQVEIQPDISVSWTPEERSSMA
jgi:hypothetical protein